MLIATKNKIYRNKSNKTNKAHGERIIKHYGIQKEGLNYTMFMDILNVIKVSIQPKRMYKVNAISIKTQTEVSEELDNLILKFV